MQALWMTGAAKTGLAASEAKAQMKLWQVLQASQEPATPCRGICVDQKNHPSDSCFSLCYKLELSYGYTFIQRIALIHQL